MPFTHTVVDKKRYTICRNEIVKTIQTTTQKHKWLENKQSSTMCSFCIITRVPVTPQALSKGSLETKLNVAR